MNYIVKLTTKVRATDLEPVERRTGLLVLEPEDYTDAEIRTIRDKGYTVLGYLSVGSISTERSWYRQYASYRLKRLDDWPKEFYMDLRKEPWQTFLVSRAGELKAAGFDGWWLDNLDVYEEYRSPEMFDGCVSVLRSIRALGGYVMVNGGSEFFDVALDRKLNLTELVNGVTQEEVFSLIKSYSGRGRFGKQFGGQSRFYQSLLKRLRKCGVETFLLEYTRDGAVSAAIEEFCSKQSMTGYYISDDVDL